MPADGSASGRMPAVASGRDRLKRVARGLPGWRSLVLARALVVGGEARRTAVAEILRPDNLFQPHATTGPDRYPDEFAIIRAALAVDPLAILSFGCSSGEELLSLRQHFPHARIHGIDVNPLAVRAARRRIRAAGEAASISVARAGDASGERPASYDVVLALAVFRHGGLNAGPDRCDELLDFADFESTIQGLSACLRPGGLLAIRHANFRFSDCAVAAGYEPVVSGIASLGVGGTPYPVYDRANRRVADDLRDDGIYRKLS